MRQKTNKLKTFAVVIALLLCLSIAPLQLSGQSVSPQTTDKQNTLSAKDKQTVDAFEKRAKQYAQMREQIEAKMPKLSKDSTPEQIQAHKVAFEDKVRAARANAKPGQIFTPDITAYIRTLIQKEFKGTDRQELRQTVLEADTKGVPLKINYPYPETKELVEMPPTLLLKLPQLPKQLRFRFVNRNLLLVDRENDLIIDYMLNALP